MAYEFDLVAEEGELRFAEGGYERAVFHLSELLPAKRVRLVGDPPSRIRAQAYGSPTEVAPGLLARVEELAGTALRFELRD